MSADIKCPACVHGQCGMCGREYANADALAALTRERDEARAHLKRANEQSEHYEREWYLRGDALEDVTRERDSLRAELDALKGQEPAYWHDARAPHRVSQHRPAEAIAHHWRPLYAAPTPAADAEALREALREARKEAMAWPWATGTFISIIDAALAADAGRAKTEGEPTC